MSKRKVAAITARCSYQERPRGKGAAPRWVESSRHPRPMPLDQLLDRLDAIAALPGSRREHGVITVTERGYVLHAYFGAGAPRFELFAPGAPGPPRPDLDAHGTAAAEDLKHAIRLIAAGHVPHPYLQARAHTWKTFDD